LFFLSRSSLPPPHHPSPIATFHPSPLSLSLSLSLSLYLPSASPLHSLLISSPPLVADSSSFSHLLPSLSLAQNLPEGILGIMQAYLKYGGAFRVEGSEW